MRDQMNDWIERKKRAVLLTVAKVFGQSETGRAIRRLEAINETLGSGVVGIADVFTDRRPSGYKNTIDEYRLRLDISDPGIRIWLTNVAQGIDQSLRTGQMRAVRNYNHLLERHSQINGRNRNHA